MSTQLGTVYLSAGAGTPVGRFEFLVERDSGDVVEIGTPVTAETIEGPVVGLVIDMRAVGSSSSPIASDFAASPFPGPDGDLSAPPPRVSWEPDAVIATAAVMHADALRPVRAGRVRPATATEVAAAAGHDLLGWAIPSGVMSLADGGYAKVCLDGHTLFGPEGQGLLVGGLSGLAAKSSYMGVVLRAAMASGSPEKNSTAALIFNVKGTDYCYLDRPPAPGYELDDRDRRIWAALGVEPTPFADVTVFAPALPGGGGTRSPRDDARPLRWDLATVFPHLKHLFGSQMWEDEKLASFFAEFRDLCVESRNPATAITTFDRLEQFWRDYLDIPRENEEPGGWRSHHPATLGRLRRMLSSLPARCGGLLTRGASSFEDDIPDRHWRHGQVVVVDIAGLTPDVQGLVIARTVERMLRTGESGELGVDHLAIVADELNAFAPSVGSEQATVRKVLQRISTQGRYAGLSLVAAGQQLSKIDDLILTNSAQRALGRTADAELGSGAYGRLATGVVERVATLAKGQVALWSPTLRAPLVVAFPRPAWQTGKATTTGATRRSALDAIGGSEASRRRLTEGLAAEVVEAIVADADDPTRAREALDRARRPDMAARVVTEASSADPADPFGLDDEVG